jgi:hypothetical protein
VEPLGRAELVCTLVLVSLHFPLHTIHIPAVVPARRGAAVANNATVHVIKTMIADLRSRRQAYQACVNARYEAT